MMKRFVLFILIAILTTAVCYGHGSHPHTHIDDGQLHVVDADNPFYGEYSIDVYRTTGIGTHIRIIDGGIASGSTTNDSFFLYHNSQFTMTGGTVTKRISTLNDVAVSISGGNLESLLIQQNSTGTVSGGTIGLLTAHGQSLTFTGGTVKEGVFAGNNGTFTMTGGRIEDFFQSYNPNSFIMGGEIQGDLVSSEGGHVTVEGGILGGELELVFDGMITLVGSDFMINGDPIDFGLYDKTFFGVNQLDQITGVLANGDPLSTYVKFIDWSSGPNYSTLELVEVVPEPTTLALLTLGTVMLRRRRA